MRAKSVFVVSFVAALGVCGCTGNESRQKASAAGQVYEAAMGRVLTALDGCNGLLASLKGPEDVPGAKANIEKAVAKVRSAEREFSGLPELPAAQKKRLSAKFGPELDKRAARLSAETARLRPAPRTPTKSTGSFMKEAADPSVIVKGTGSGSVLVDSVRDHIETVKTRIKKKLQVRTSAAGAVRG